MMTPETRHTQVSVQITTKTPFSFRCHNNFSAQIQRYNDTAYKMTSAFSFALQFVQRRSSPSSAVAAAVSFHHSGLLLLFASSFQHVAFVCPNQLQCSHLILLRWGLSFALCPPFPQRLQLNLNSVAARVTSLSLLSFMSESAFPEILKLSIIA
jgi:hypothetical protein